MSNCKNGLFKSHPKSMFVRYIDIVKDSDTLEDQLLVWGKYSYYYNVNGRCAMTFSDEPEKKIPVVVLQIVQVGDRVWAEVLKKEDYNNETLF